MLMTLKKLNSFYYYKETSNLFVDFYTSICEVKYLPKVILSVVKTIYNKIAYNRKELTGYHHSFDGYEESL